MIETSIIIPVRNEESFIEDCLQSIMENNYSKDNFEVLIIDGESSDHTIEKIKNFKWGDCNYKILVNHNKSVPYALNMGIEHASGKYIIRMDCHTTYDQNYIENCVNLLKETKAMNVGGPMRVAVTNPISESISIATSSKFGIGNAQFHFTDYSGEVDSVYLGAFNKKIFSIIGNFDEKLTRNQDDEFNLRIIKSGHKIYQSTKIISHYTPRPSISKLFSQYFQYGYWKPAVIKKHSGISSLRHLIPSMFVLYIYVCFLITAAIGFNLIIFLPLLSYAIMIIYVTSLKKVQYYKTFFLLPAVFFTLHISYGHGFILGLFKWFGIHRD